MPIGPRARVELAGFRVLQHVDKDGIADRDGKRLHVIVVAEIHHVGDDAFRPGRSLSGGLPPDVLPGEQRDKWMVGRNHCLFDSLVTSDTPQSTGYREHRRSSPNSSDNPLRASIDQYCVSDHQSRESGDGSYTSDAQPTVSDGDSRASGRILSRECGSLVVKWRALGGEE